MATKSIKNFNNGGKPFIPPPLMTLPLKKELSFFAASLTNYKDSYIQLSIPNNLIYVNE